MDSETIGAIAKGAAQGSTATVIYILGTSGTNWLKEKFRNHSTSVQEKAQTNLENFVWRLSQRVERLEKDMPPQDLQLYKKAFGQPDCSLLVQRAMLSAAITENEDKHIILSELIAQRLTAEADDLIALSGAAACDVVNALSSNHIRLLGLIAKIFVLRPLEQPIFTDQEAYDEYILNWWSNLPLLGRDFKFASLDLDHLFALGCVRNTFAFKPIESLLPINNISPMNLTLHKFNSFQWWPQFEEFWKRDLNYYVPTTIGMLIGTIYYDEIFKTNTIINW